MLEVRGVSAGYGELHVLHDVSLSVGKGQVVALVGANGAGKSTTINSISGLVRPRSGEIKLEGRSLVGLAPNHVVDAGVVQVPEGRRLFSGMTVRENLLLGGTARRARGEREGTMSMVHELFPVLRERGEQLAGTLSGGEQQMVAIGRALMSRPDVLMLDEPSLGLAPLMVREIFRVIKHLSEQHVAILLVEQNVKHSLSICDYGYVLENGRIVLEGTGGELLNNEHTKRAYVGM